MEETTTQIFPATSIPTQPFWPALHALYNSAYASSDPNYPLPQPFYRLHPDLVIAGPHFTNVLGPEGFVAVTFAKGVDGENFPVAAISAMPWNDTMHAAMRLPPHDPSQPMPYEWEFNHVVTAASWRGKGLASKLVTIVEGELVKKCTEKDPDRRVRMLTMTMEEISGPFWRGRGYTTVKEMAAVLPKGFSHLEGLGGLRRDVQLWGGEKWLR